ncbi:EAL domain-containing protein [bacterium]|nr:EAL domain-containing protein [bacterium]MBU1995296.1 EAL domain-containing protein [bacterium]
MKKIINSLFFYPALALFIIFSGLLGLYIFSLEEAKETITQQTMQRSKEDAFLLKSIIEELSIAKKSSLIQREISRAATRKNIKYILLVSPDGTVLYGDRLHIISQTIEEVFGSIQASHYLKETRDKAGIHIHPTNSNHIDTTINLNYLYNPIHKILEKGHLLILSDLSAPLSEKKAELQTEFFQIYLGISFTILVLFYLYYRHFLRKLLYLEKISSQLQSSVKNRKFKQGEDFSLDTIVNRLTQTTQDLALMSHVIHFSNDAILITDKEKNIISVNPAFEELSGYNLKELLGKKPESLVKSHLMDQHFYINMWESIHKNGCWNGEIIDRRKNGSSYTVWQNIFTLQEPASGELSNYVAISKDISELMQKQREIENLAYYDGLTNLANRSYFLHLLNKLILQNNRIKHHFAMIYADLDDFKEINDTLGHAAGDKVLQQFALSLTQKLRSADIICRLGGDEFAIITPDITTPDGALEIANKIIGISKIPILIEGKMITVNVSVGVALYPDDGIDEKSLLKAADLAMYKSKENGKNQVTLFQEQMQKEANKRVQIREDLQNAIKNKEFILQYQPKVNTNTQIVSGFEVLIRWKHPKRGLIPPYEFIWIAEESGLIVPMTEWIFQEVNSVCGRFKEVSNHDFSFAINISAKHFQEQNLIVQIESSLQKQWIQNGCIEIEVTESAVMKEIEKAKEQLHALHGLGIKVSLDDYGTGHSSLSYLKHLPIDTIKIDKSFVDGITYDKKDRAIVSSTIQLAKNLGIITVVEGVETEEQARYVKDFGADFIQGYLYFKPLDEKDAMALCQHLNS